MSTEKLSGRIKAFREATGLKQKEIAKKLGISAAYLSELEKGKKESISTSLAKLIGREFGIGEKWLLTGEGSMFLGKASEPSGDFVSIPLYDVHAAAGSGSIIETEHVKTMMSFSRSVLEELNVPPKSLACLYVSGDSMEPTIRAGELVVIDTSDTTFTFDGGVYILRIDSTLLIKRLIRKSAEEIEVVSDNKERGSFKISTKEIDGNYAIVGRVVLGWRRL